MFKLLRVRIVYFVAGVVRVPVKIRDTYYGAEYKSSNTKDYL